jgi:hypothetical protein
MIVSFHDDTASQPASERADSTLTPDELTLLANNFEPELADHFAQRVDRGSFLYERPLECRILVQKVDESVEYFRCRIEVEKNDVRTEVLKPANLRLKRNDEKRDWNTDEVLIFLNNLEDAWRYHRGFRTDEDGSAAYVCTFVPEKHEGQELAAAEPLIRIRYPIESLKGDIEDEKEDFQSATMHTTSP